MKACRLHKFHMYMTGNGRVNNIGKIICWFSMKACTLMTFYMCMCGKGKVNNIGKKLFFGAL